MPVHQALDPPPYQQLRIVASSKKKMAGLDPQQGKLFQDKWVQHLRAKSAAAQLYCQYCSVHQGFPSEGELLHHMRRHHPEKEKGGGYNRYILLVLTA